MLKFWIPLYLCPSILKLILVRDPDLQPLLGMREVSLGFARDLRADSCFSWFISVQ